MQKLDGKFYGQIHKAKDDTVVNDDEWVLFLAKDNAFAAVLPLYLEECIKQGADDRQIEGVKELIERVNIWRRAHPDKCHVPDIAASDKLLA